MPACCFALLVTATADFMVITSSYYKIGTSPNFINLILGLAQMLPTKSFSEKQNAQSEKTAAEQEN
jgi:hypothetical protein